MSYHVRVLAGRIDRKAGSHFYHLELVRRLSRRGHRVSLVCFAPGADVLGCEEVFAVPAPTPAGRFLWRFQTLLNARHYRRALDRLPLAPVDVVVGGEHLFLKSHQRRFPRTPWIYLPHSLLIDQEIRSYNYPPLMQWISTTFYVRLQRWALNNATRTMRFTHMACDAMNKRYGRSVKPRYAVIPQATNLPEAMVREAPEGPVRLLWVGQLIPRKRIDLALESLAHLKHLAWVFDIVGDGESRATLESQARQAGLSDRVRFHGFQPSPEEWYRRADLLLFPSWLENFPLTMLEAMARGVPCLAFRGDGVRYHNANGEILRHNQDGFLADSDEDFCRQLGELIAAPAMLRSAGEQARQTVAERYTWEHHLDQLEALFEELARQGRKSTLVEEAGNSRPRLAESLPKHP
jgi:glycosyltransferase involved in cell wall biosynthesis